MKNSCGLYIVCTLYIVSKESILKDYGIMLCSSRDPLGITISICWPPGVWEEVCSNVSGEFTDFFCLVIYKHTHKATHIFIKRTFLWCICIRSSHFECLCFGFLYYNYFKTFFYIQKLSTESVNELHKLECLTWYGHMLYLGISDNFSLTYREFCDWTRWRKAGLGAVHLSQDEEEDHSTLKNLFLKPVWKVGRCQK